MLKSGLVLLGALCVSWSLQAAEHNCEQLLLTGNPEYPPYLWRDPQQPQQLIGANADLAKRIGLELGIKVQVLYTGPWSRAQQEVKSGRYDMLAGAFLTAERLGWMDYVYPAFLSATSVVWQRKEADWPYLGWESLRNRKGATVVNNSFGQAFDRFAEDFLTVEEVPALDQALGMLLRGRIDYVLYERYPAQAHVDKQGFTGQIEAQDPAISAEGLYLTLSHTSPCNTPTLRGQLAQVMLRLAGSGVPEELLAINAARWREQQRNHITPKESP
ncbi:substrate-binding periplasmic protein [Atopomonas hussainii]|uniref:substrate-binding periplasmic protein n=1 Tax=Atopomonas hussainii TaxID=1429083 RepID=UPI0009002B00|nr:transporter substrate-binding domain-containing protein [Atopomonas hussainii]